MLADEDYNNYQTNELLQYYIKTECQIIMMSLRNARKLCKKNNFFVLIIIGITKLFFIRVMVNYSDQCALKHHMLSWWIKQIIATRILPLGLQIIAKEVSNK